MGWTRTNMRNQTAIFIPEPNKRNQSAPLVDPNRRTQITVPEATKKNQTTILISEPNKMYCDLLKKAFYVVRNRFQVVACASTTAEILAGIEETRPLVAIVSANLQDGPLTGIRILPEIRRLNSDTRTLVALEAPEPDLVIEAFRFGADGVFCRNSPFDLLCKSVEAVSQGQIWASNDELRYVLNAFAKSSKQRKMDSNVEGRMTKREAEVVRLAVEGLSNREIGQQLGLTEHTVKNYLFRVFDKLGVSNRVELVLSCLRQEEDVREEMAGEQRNAAPPR
jgi:DNA-binding NarL/FixJ family response regulator